MGSCINGFGGVFGNEDKPSFDAGPTQEWGHSSANDNIGDFSSNKLITSLDCAPFEPLTPHNKNEKDSLLSKSKDTKSGGNKKPTQHDNTGYTSILKSLYNNIRYGVETPLVDLITASYPMAEQPPCCKIPLWDHQRKMLRRCQEIERNDLTIGAITDAPGSGKTNVILSLISEYIRKENEEYLRIYIKIILS